MLVGAGAGLSAAAGLRYDDARLFARWFPGLHAEGIETLWDAVVKYWLPDDANRLRFWAFWANHAQKARYDAPPGKVYLDLLQVLDGKDYFIITTNADGQFLKAGFDPQRMFTPQGEYAVFQCAVPCHPAVYDNREMVGRMVANMDREAYRVREEDIPRCPVCGGYMERNLRQDDRFVEAPYMGRQKDYADFINASMAGRLVMLELGAGFNTPGIIRWPFERLAQRHPEAALIRINLEDAGFRRELGAKAVGFKEDAAVVVADFLKGMNPQESILR